MYRDKIPKYIEKLINRRTELALELAEVSSKLDGWLEKQGISLDTDYTTSGCMIYCEPYTAAECVRQDIIRHFKQQRYGKFATDTNVGSKLKEMTEGKDNA